MFLNDSPSNLLLFLDCRYIRLLLYSRLLLGLVPVPVPPNLVRGPVLVLLDLLSLCQVPPGSWVLPLDLVLGPVLVLVPVPVPPNLVRGPVLVLLDLLSLCQVPPGSWVLPLDLVLGSVLVLVPVPPNLVRGPVLVPVLDLLDLISLW